MKISPPVCKNIVFTGNKSTAAKHGGNNFSSNDRKILIYLKTKVIEQYFLSNK